MNKQIKLSDVEEDIKNFYQDLWSEPSKIKRKGKEIFLGWHYGFYEKGIKSISEAMSNMNKYIERLLKLDNKKSLKIFDLGSGVGATTLHLAKKYPNCNFYGITLTSNEYKIAKSLKKQTSVNNVEFLQGSYMKSGFDNGYFDRIFALESALYAPDKKAFLREIDRLLKKNGKIIIIDTFVKKNLMNQFNKNLDNYLYNRNKSEEELLNYYINIFMFEKYINKLNFRSIKIKDLVKSKNVKKTHIYGFLIYRYFITISSQLKKIKNKKKISTVRYIINYPFIFSTIFLYKVALISITKPSYYVIEEIKK